MSLNKKTHLCWQTVVSVRALHEVRVTMCVIPRTVHAVRVSPTSRHCRTVHVAVEVSCGLACQHSHILTSLDVNILKYIITFCSHENFALNFK